MRYLVYLTMLLQVLLSPLAAQAAPEPLVVPAGNVSIGLAPYLEWLPVPGVGSLDEARARDGDFTAVPGDANLGQRRGSFWFRVALRNTAPEPRDYLLAIDFDKLDTLAFHQVRADGSVTRIDTGMARSFRSRQVAIPGFVFPVRMAAGETTDIYLQAEGSVVLFLPATLHSAATLVADSTRDAWWQGIFFGLVAGLLAYNLFLWWTTRDTTFLYFVGTGVTAAGYFAGLDGMFYRVLPDAVLFNQSFMFVAGALSVTMTLQFTRHFLGIARVNAALDRWLFGYAMAMALVALGIAFLPVVVALALVLVGSIGMAVLMLLAGITARRARLQLSGVFVVVVAIHLSVLVLLGISALAVFDGMYETTMVVHRISLAIILSLFSLALGERIKDSSRARHEAEAEVLQARAEMRARNDFLSKMSHELRTPMTGVLGMAELLDHTELQPQQRRYLSTLRYSGEMLLNLINDVLDHARIQTGRLQLRREAFDLLRLVDDCRLLFEQQPRDNGVHLRIDVGSGMPRVVVGDMQRIRQVLVNLLANAFRFTQRGEVVLRVVPQAEGWLRFEVQDTGSAIDPGDLERMFLGQPAPEGRMVRGSVGLGLGICRQLCELMGGRIGAAGRDGEGALFWFELPLHAAVA